MPYYMRGNYPGCTGWAVLNTAGALVSGGCHAKKADAVKHLKALYREVGDDTQAGAAETAGTFSHQDNHPDCPAGRPHATTDADGHAVMCHVTPKDAQDLALTLNIPDASPAPAPGGNTTDSPSVTAAGDTATPGMPALATWPDVELVAVGEWDLSSGPASFTTADLQSAVGAADCPAVGPPILKLGHIDPRFDGEPAIGRVSGMRLNDSMTKIVGDFTGMPGWLADILPSAYPQRSVEGGWNFPCQMGHVHPFVITAVALLGVAPPGVGIIASLSDIAALYGIEAAAPAEGAEVRTFTLTLIPGDVIMPPAGSTVAAAGTNTTIDDVRREFYESAPWSQWIIELQLEPLVLIVSDDSTGDLYRVPVGIDAKSPGEVTFGSPETVLVQYITAPAVKAEAAKGGPLRRIAAAWAGRDSSRAGMPVAMPVTAAWDSSAQVANLGDEPTSAQLAAMFALPGDTKSDSKLPHHTVSSDGKVGAADADGCSAAMGAINGARGGLAGVSAADKKKAYDHVAAHMTSMDMEPPEMKAAAAAMMPCPECDGTGMVDGKKCPMCDGTREVPAAGTTAGGGLAGWPVEDLTTAAARLDRLARIRAAAGDTDADENVSKLLASLDATLDQASQLSAGVDRSKVDEPTGQALDLITAAEALADQLMELLGIFDPDDAAAVTAGGAHSPMEGEHEHPHAAFGAQGGDQTHTHMHAHQNDAVHKHVHGAMSSAPPPPTAPAAAAARKEGNPDMEFTTEQMAAIRARLGKQDGEDITPADIAAAFAGPKIEAGAATAVDGKLPPIEEGSYLVDSEILRDWQSRAAAGDAAVHAMHVNERDRILAEAVSIGKFPQSKMDAYRDRWNKDPEGTRELVAALAAGLVPVGTGPIGRPGLDTDMPGVDFEQADAYRKLYPDDVAAGRGGRGR